MKHTLLLGKCEERLAELAADSVNCVVTDPPFALLEEDMELTE